MSLGMMCKDNSTANGIVSYKVRTLFRDCCPRLRNRSHEHHSRFKMRTRCALCAWCDQIISTQRARRRVSILSAAICGYNGGTPRPSHGSFCKTLYDGTISVVNRDGTYDVSWKDGTENYNFKDDENLRKKIDPRIFKVGDSVQHDPHNYSSLPLVA